MFKTQGATRPMAHQSLYRKYRPATFDEVVGQQPIERTLRNAVAEGKVAHAYLFTGPRGTGKTTTARLLAKALLCERAPAAEPDGTCEECRAVAEGNHPDVFELDAASHTQVDIVRDQIINRVQYAPTRGAYKIYIIDEVHMLSPSSFNALLKTLEEPPSHVVFVMCTTHPHKVPDTIHSRCQRFDFHRISVEDVADHLRFIAESEGFKVDRGAFTLIARHADGGMRDAITALEQLAAYTGGEITVDDVEGMLCEVDSSQLFTLAGLMARQDVAGCFVWVADIVETGADVAELVRELTGHVRDLYVATVIGDVSGIVDRPADEMALLIAQAAEFGGPSRIEHVLDVLVDLAAELRWSSDPRLSLEIALTRMARPQGETTLPALAARVETVERALRSGAGPLPAAVPAVSVGASESTVDAASEKMPASEPAPEPVAVKAAEQVAPSVAPAAESAGADAVVASPGEAAVHPVGEAGTIDRASAKRAWKATLVEVKKLRPARAHTFAMVEIDVDADERTLVLEFPKDQQFSLQLAEEPETRILLRDALAVVFGVAPPFRYQLGRGPVRPVLEPEAPPRVAEATPEAEPAVTTAEPVAAAVEPAVAAPQDAVAAESAEPASSDGSAEPASDLEHVLFNQLGAQMVSEHPANERKED
ncbi:MAG: DNA polymerase III subunit gamma/tau [Coriobacteriia bacterium]|nr:DNA polymerase III subunit gamma/tau [Coriobacteriia bacterium]